MATIVKYNNSTVATLEVGSSATLNCKDKKMASNLTVIENNVPTELPVYNGAVIVEEGAKMISFTISNKSYEAEEGMTWGEWIESNYNPSEESGYHFKIIDGYVCNNVNNRVYKKGDSSIVYRSDDVIDPSIEYNCSWTHSGGAG